MNPQWKRWGVRILKLVLALVVLFFIGWQFARDLNRGGDDGKSPLDLEWRPGWFLASGVLYLVGLLSAAWFWRHLLCLFGYPISLYAAIRAHYIGQLGKYVPGKALAIAIRADLVHPLGVPYGVSVIASFYEVFTGMAAGAIVAAIIYVIEPPTVSEVEWHPLGVGAVLIGLCGIPLLPGVFNFVIARLAVKLPTVEQYRLPPVRFGTLARGLVVSALGWWLQGLSWWMMLQAVLPEPPDFTFAWWWRCTASIAFANVAGFAMFFLPAGLGAREFLLLTLLRSFVPPAYLVPAAILLRLNWIVAETLFALCTYWFKPNQP